MHRDGLNGLTNQGKQAGASGFDFRQFWHSALWPISRQCRIDAGDDGGFQAGTVSVAADDAQSAGAVLGGEG